MKILLVNFEYPPLGGGGGIATRDIARELANKHEVHVLTSHYEHLPYTAVQENVTIHRVPVFGRRQLATATLTSLAMFIPTACIWGFWLCVKERFSVINAQFVIPSGIPAAMLSMIFRIPFVLSLVGGDIYDPSKGVSPHRHGSLRALIRLVASKADAITAISSDTKQRAQDLHGIRGEITVIPLGIHPRKTQDASLDDINIPIRPNIVAVSVGRLIPRKGYETLLQAWKDIPNVTLLIIGEGPLLNSLTKMIADYSLMDRVFLLGFLPDIKKQRILNAVDMYVSAAEHEGFGLVFLEGMDAGLPIIATNEGGQRDFLTDGVHGFLVPPHNPTALAQAVRQLADNKQLRDDMSVRNRADVKAYYLSETVGVFEAVLQRVINTRSL